MIRVAIIGFGKWGEKILTSLKRVGGFEVIAVADIKDRRQKLAPDISFTFDYHTLLTRKDIKAVFIATPSETHSTIAKEFLENNKAVFLEKPMATSLSAARELFSIAQKRRAILLIGHILLYHPAFWRIKEEIKGKGDFLVKIKRFNPTAEEIPDLPNYLLAEFAPHDIALALYLFGPPEAVRLERGESSLRFSLSYPHGEMRGEWGINGKGKLREFSFQAPDLRIIFRDGEKEVSINEDTVPLNMRYSPLEIECLSFRNSILEKKEPFSSQTFGLQVSEIIHQLQKGL